MKKKQQLQVWALMGALVFGWATLGQASTIFQDDFNTEGPVGNNYTSFDYWTVTQGAIDLLGPGYGDYFPGNGNYVDLDGTTFHPGTLETNMNFAAGEYDLSFYLGGSRRDDSNTVTLTFGNYSENFFLVSSDPLTLFTRHLTILGGKLSFQNDGGDGIDGLSNNKGAILDNVLVTTSPVPEPATLLLFGTGIIGLVGAIRKKKV